MAMADCSLPLVPLLAVPLLAVPLLAVPLRALTVFLTDFIHLQNRSACFILIR